MVYPTNHQLLNDAYDVLCASSNLDEVKSIVEGCPQLLAYEGRERGRRNNSRRRRNGNGDNVNVNANNNANNNGHGHGNGNNGQDEVAYNYIPSWSGRPLYRICGRINHNHRSNSNNSEDLDIILYLIQKSIDSNHNNDDGKGGLLSMGLGNIWFDATPLHQLVIWNRIAILRHLAGIAPARPQSHTTLRQQGKVQIQVPIITPQDVLTDGLIFKAIECQHFEMCRFLFTELNHPNLIVQSFNSRTMQTKNDYECFQNTRDGQLPIQFCCGFYSKNIPFWKEVFPYLLKMGLKYKFHEDTKQERQRRKHHRRHRHQHQHKERKQEHHWIKNPNDEHIELIQKYWEISVGGLFVRDKEGNNSIDIMSHCDEDSSEHHCNISNAIQAILLLTREKEGRKDNVRDNGLAQEHLQQPQPQKCLSLHNLPLLQGLIISDYQFNQYRKKHESPSSRSIRSSLPYIQALIKHCPESVSNRDNHSSLPIHIGAKYGLKWNDGMKDIVGANSNYIWERDVTTGLLPFALAGVSIMSIKNRSDGSGSGGGRRNKNNNCPANVLKYDLDTIFELIRSCPDTCKKYEEERRCLKHNKRSKKRKRKRKRKKKRKGPIIKEEIHS